MRCRDVKEAGTLFRRARARDPRKSNNIKPLKGRLAGSYRYRLGDLRVVYTVRDEEVTVFVNTIAKRSDVYD